MSYFSAAKVARFYLQKSGVKGKRHWELMNPDRMVKVFHKCLLCLRPQEQELINSVKSILTQINQTQTA